MALVICCVFFTDLIRRRMSNKFAIELLLGTMI
jgi:Flp pilus assembly protein protease CpaA